MKNFNEIENNENTENNNDFEKEYKELLKKNRKHSVARTLSMIMAMAIVSTGSVGLYSAIEKNTEKTSTTATSSASSETSKSDTTSSVSAEQMSLLNVNGSNKSSLTTEQVVDKVLPSVVGIESNFTYKNDSTGNSNFYGGFSFGNENGNGSGNGNGQQQTQGSTMTATGTGVVITTDGYIVTNAHVIYDSEYNCGLASSISVLMSDEKKYDATVVGYDTDCDIAVLKIDATNLTAAEFGDSSSLDLGESVIAIGNPLGFELKDTVTSGIISGLNREITINDMSMNLIQTDAAINSGNSGGPLINKYGQVIGINSSKMSSSYSETTIEGIGFAIQSNEVSKIVDQLMKYGYVTGKPQLGISCQDVTETISQMYNLPVGVYVTAVTDGSAAATAGIKEGDVITAIDGKDITTSEELTAAKNKHSAGETVTLKINRNGETKELNVVLDEEKQQAKK
ncbi:MAG: trypsin-like peptidase domain-containing protein [Ruminococcus sp.]|jgi:serine protease Do|nr:trypsin-like peptidase domain-containing protein [Ruminococcus sp.]